MKKVLFLCFVFCPNLWANWDGLIYDTRTKSPVSMDQLAKEIINHDIAVLGESHYSSKVQLAQAHIMRSALELKGGEWSLGWEFLAHTQSEKNNQAWEQVVEEKTSIEEFLKHTQGPGSSLTYAPLFQVAKDFRGQIVGLNLTRSEKNPVVKHGISALSPELLPPGFEMLGNQYKKRFSEVMGEHVSPDLLNNYFEAQCLTDDVMAYQALKNRRGILFLVAGHFHTNYGDGTISRIKSRSPQTKVINIRVFDASEYKESEVFDQFMHPEYGYLSDFIYIVNEPKE